MMESYQLWSRVQLYVVFQSPVWSGLLHYFWCNWTQTGLSFLAILGNWTKTGMDQLPTVTIKTATSFGPVFIWTSPKLEVTSCNWLGSMTSKCLLMHPPPQHGVSTRLKLRHIDTPHWRIGAVCPQALQSCDLQCHGVVTLANSLWR